MGGVPRKSLVISLDHRDLDTFKFPFQFYLVIYEMISFDVAWHFNKGKDHELPIHLSERIPKIDTDKEVTLLRNE